MNVFLGGYADTRIREHAVSVNPSRSQEIEYLSGWIRGYAVSVDPTLSQEMVSTFLSGYA